MTPHSYMTGYSQLTLVSLDALGGTEALPSVDVAHVGMAVALACWREKTKVEREREMCFNIQQVSKGYLCNCSISASSSKTCILHINTIICEHCHIATWWIPFKSMKEAVWAEIASGQHKVTTEETLFPIAFLGNSSSHLRVELTIFSSLSENNTDMVNLIQYSLFYVCFSL